MVRMPIPGYAYMVKDARTVKYASPVKYVYMVKCAYNTKMLIR